MNSLSCHLRDSGDLECPFISKWQVLPEQEPITFQAVVTCPLPNSQQNTQDNDNGCSCQALVLDHPRGILDEAEHDVICQCHTCSQQQQQQQQQQQEFMGLDTMQMLPQLALYNCNHPLLDGQCWGVDCDGSCQTKVTQKDSYAYDYESPLPTPTCGNIAHPVHSFMDFSSPPPATAPSKSEQQLSSSPEAAASKSLGVAAAQSASLMWMLGLMAFMQNTTDPWTETLTSHDSIAW